ncbi:MULTISPECIES: MFS transporter [Clostridium]|uniref:Inner membrane transport protein YdiM n=3 Tax=Clostridium TaxID=1485 RepID=D8GNQ6_CLOLD|nr:MULTISPECIES: MFS transporter [Clostridium]ADK15919.1 predicted transporter protein, MFS family [Clostridium ljungdahlii DSM 13528]AGY75093.1 MFS transporter [Clostridium autoethanogenum DSM 10061]ALU35265.1 Major facilitator superfamily MFS_1 [Clostridium autoethanogenum DSM 10061]OAA87203.1 Inner membrane transport protein YdiM [Clostridium ljungdahlii DSM 13528]OVY49656.1 Inner membrane transport protein YdiM [Clostridium autoethanogenum]
MNNKKYYPTALALYLAYFIHGIGVSILGQYKQNFAGVWGAKTLANGTFDVSVVLAVIAALGLGRLIGYPFAGPVSDKLGRRVSGLIGIVFYIAYFVGIIIAPNMYVAYIFALIGGAANSFLDTCITPSCLEIFVDSGDAANMFTKFSISLGQLLLPFGIGFVSASHMSYKTIFIVTAILLVIDGILIATMPFPPMNNNAKGKPKEKRMKFTVTSIALICIGFTCTSTFQLWLNCNQELGKLYGLANLGQIQSYYAVGSMLAVLITAALVKGFLKPVRVLVLYPLISTIMLIIIYFIQTPTICLIGGFVIGFTAAGGVLQLVTSTANAMFPANKGKITSIVMIASSIANYVILNIASVITKSGGANGPKYVVLFNAVITIIGVLLSVFVNRQYAKYAIEQ